MHISTGVDIVDISRIEKSIKKASFISKVYGINEIDIYKSRGCKASFLAGNFAAKEAFSKALGTGVRGFSLNEVEILRDSLGSPYFSLCGKAKKIVEDNGYNLSLSISHEKTYAVAFVTAFKD